MLIEKKENFRRLKAPNRQYNYTQNNFTWRSCLFLRFFATAHRSVFAPLKGNSFVKGYDRSTGARKRDLERIFQRQTGKSPAFCRFSPYFPHLRGDAALTAARSDPNALHPSPSPPTSLNRGSLIRGSTCGAGTRWGRL